MDNEPRPHLLPTRPATLALIAFAAGVCGWVVVRSYYSDLPALPWIPSVILWSLTVVEFVLARTTTRRISRREFIEPLAIARFAALAKASSILGAAYAGFFAGFAIWLFRYLEGVDAAQRDMWRCGVAVVVGVLLTGAALLLERACRIPPSGQDSTERDK
ncbi:MAG: DUF3180 domain-containing protein [Corynebacteriales bacterium]|nr:DUF3180 domain-containing protein [Mycobacteriales bacterium]